MISNTGTFNQVGGFFTTSEGPAQMLPVPKVRLYPISPVDGSSNYVEVEYLDNGGNVGGTYKLFNFPQVIASDLTDAQIKAGVYVEMVAYRRGKSPTDNNSGHQVSGGYIVPSPWIGGVNPLNGRWSRGGGHTFSGIGALNADRPNHYQVTAHNEIINVYEYLHNRYKTGTVLYRDTTANQQGLQMLIPSSRDRSANFYPSTRFAYSARHTPYYFAFRYVMWDEEARKWNSGPLSRVIKHVPKQHPFNYDAAASNTNGVPCCNISPNFDQFIFNCWFETRLP